MDGCFLAWGSGDGRAPDHEQHHEAGQERADLCGKMGSGGGVEEQWGLRGALRSKGGMRNKGSGQRTAR